MQFYRIAWQIHMTERIRSQYGDALSASAAELLDDIEELLRAFNLARQYIQTLYMQKELAELSRLLLYFGIPSLLLIGFTMLLYTPGRGTTLGVWHFEVVFSIAGSVAFLPLLILFAYVIRVSTIVSRMPLISPFINDG